MNQMRDEALARVLAMELSRMDAQVASLERQRADLRAWLARFAAESVASPSADLAAGQ